jgi:arsenate reductase (thioredoxin)
MAEGLLRQLGGSAFEAHSAGRKPNGYVGELAVDAMRAVGVDISAHRSKSVSEFEGQHFDTVITVCDRAAELCPVFPGASESTGAFPDPGNARAKISSPSAAAYSTSPLPASADS